MPMFPKRQVNSSHHQDGTALRRFLFISVGRSRAAFDGVLLKDTARGFRSHLSPTRSQKLACPCRHAESAFRSDSFSNGSLHL